MDLQDEIKEFKQQMAPNIPSEAAKIMTGAITDLKTNSFADRAIKKGDKAPQFELPNIQGKTISSTNLLSKGPLVMNFFRGSW